MRAEFFRPEDPEKTVGTAYWEDGRPRIEAEDSEARAALERVFQPVSVVIVDSALRPRGSRGETVIEPGDLEWFRAAAAVRGEREGLSVRLASDAPGGWDPAGAYRSMPAWVARKESSES